MFQKFVFCFDILFHSKQSHNFSSNTIKINNFYLWKTSASQPFGKMGGPGRFELRGELSGSSNIQLERFFDGIEDSRQHFSFKSAETFTWLSTPLLGPLFPKYLSMPRCEMELKSETDTASKVRWNLFLKSIIFSSRLMHVDTIICCDVESSWSDIFRELNRAGLILHCRVIRWNFPLSCRASLTLIFKT